MEEARFGASIYRIKFLCSMQSNTKKQQLLILIHLQGNGTTALKTIDAPVVCFISYATVSSKIQANLEKNLIITEQNNLIMTSFCSALRGKGIRRTGNLRQVIGHCTHHHHPLHTFFLICLILEGMAVRRELQQWLHRHCFA